MLDLETAIALLLEALPAPTPEEIPLAAAAGRILAKPIIAPLDLPAFDNSAMDGYAVRAADVAGAKSDSPICLRLQSRIVAGENDPGKLASGECARVFTGAPLPQGADAVVMQEDASQNGDQVLIRDSVRPREHVRFQGEDVRQGTTLAEIGMEITPAWLGLLGALGFGTVTVGRRPVVGLLATGAELTEPSRPLAPGHIYESNRNMLAALVARAGALPQIYPIAPDELEATRTALEHAFRDCDVVVTSGGVSVGEMDFVKEAFTSLGGNLRFWKVAIRPGKPFVFGALGEKLLFGLPGNPVSAFTTFLLLVRPALQRWQGAQNLTLPSSRGVLGEPVTNSGERRHFMRVRVDSTGRIFSAGPQASHALRSLADADGLLEVPSETIWPAGQAVEIRIGF